MEIGGTNWTNNSVEPNTNRPRWRSRQRYEDRIKEDLRILGVWNADEIAKNRE